MTLVKWNNGSNGYAPTFANLFDTLVGDISHVVGNNDSFTSLFSFSPSASWVEIVSLSSSN